MEQRRQPKTVDGPCRGGDADGCDEYGAVVAQLGFGAAGADHHHGAESRMPDGTDEELDSGIGLRSERWRPADAVPKRRGQVASRPLGGLGVGEAEDDGVLVALVERLGRRRP